MDLAEELVLKTRLVVVVVVVAVAVVEGVMVVAAAAAGERRRGRSPPLPPPPPPRCFRRLAFRLSLWRCPSCRRLRRSCCAVAVLFASAQTTHSILEQSWTLTVRVPATI